MTADKWVLELRPVGSSGALAPKICFTTSSSWERPLERTPIVVRDILSPKGMSMELILLMIYPRSRQWSVFGISAYQSFLATTCQIDYSMIWFLWWSSAVLAGMLFWLGGLDWTVITYSSMLQTDMIGRIIPSSPNKFPKLCVTFSSFFLSFLVNITKTLVSLGTVSSIYASCHLHSE